MGKGIKITIAVLSILLILAVGLLVREYFILHHERLIGLRELPLSVFVAKHGPLTADETGVIRGWMTFEYVNKVFALPPDFLKNAFGVEDPSYPNLTLSHYSYEKGFTETEFLTALQATVSNYLSSSSQSH